MRGGEGRVGGGGGGGEVSAMTRGIDKGIRSSTKSPLSSSRSRSRSHSRSRLSPTQRAVFMSASTLAASRTDAVESTNYCEPEAVVVVIFVVANASVTFPKSGSFLTPKAALHSASTLATTPADA